MSNETQNTNETLGGEQAMNETLMMLRGSMNAFYLAHFFQEMNENKDKFIALLETENPAELPIIPISFEQLLMIPEHPQYFEYSAEQVEFYTYLLGLVRESFESGKVINLTVTGPDRIYLVYLEEAYVLGIDLPNLPDITEVPGTISIFGSRGEYINDKIMGIIYLFMTCWDAGVKRLSEAGEVDEVIPYMRKVAPAIEQVLDKTLAKIYYEICTTQTPMHQLILDSGENHYSWNATFNSETGMILTFTDDSLEADTDFEEFFSGMADLLNDPDLADDDDDDMTEEEINESISRSSLSEE